MDIPRRPASRCGLVLAVPRQPADKARLARLLQRRLLQLLAFGVGVVVEAHAARAQCWRQLRQQAVGRHAGQHRDGRAVVQVLRTVDVGAGRGDRIAAQLGVEVPVDRLLAARVRRSRRGDDDGRVCGYPVQRLNARRSAAPIPA